MKRFKEIYQWCCEPRQLFFLFIIVLAIPNVALFFTEQMPLLVRICNIILPVSVYWMVMTLSRKPGKIIWILFPFVFFAAFQLVLLYLFGQSIIAVDMFLNLLTTNSGEAMELLDNLLPAVIGVFVVYLPTLALGIVSITGNKKLDQYFIYRQRRYARMTMGVGVILTALCYADHEDYALKLDMYPVNVCYNLTLAIERAGETAGYQESSKDFTFGAQATHDKDEAEIYVLVVGETARACNFGLYGYERNTTPLLDKTEGLVAFTDVLTQSNTTHKSVPMLLSGASAENYNRIYREKGIITAFKEAGFHTAFFSNQRPNHSFIDFFGMEADEWKFIKEDAPEETNISDDELLKLVDKQLNDGHRKLFIVLHMYGSHFNYKERYPSSAMLYTSDHGEDIFDDDRKLFLHASPVPSYYQLHVPFLIWMSEAYRKGYPVQYEAVCMNREKPVAGNASVFHSMLSLGGIQTDYKEDSLSVASKRYVIRPRYYLNDHNLPKLLDKIGLKEKDIKQLEHRRMMYP